VGVGGVWMMWTRERVGVIPTIDSCGPVEGREKREVMGGRERVMGGVEWSVRDWSVDE
jgi:hypothetical protein